MPASSKIPVIKGPIAVLKIFIEVNTDLRLARDFNPYISAIMQDSIVTPEPTEAPARNIAPKIA